MKRSKKSMMLVCLVGLILVCSGIGQAAEITLRYSGGLPLTHHVTKTQEFFAKLVEEKTAGRVKILVYPANQLFADKDTMKAIPSGAVDIGQVTLSQWTGLAPSLMFLDLPIFFDDREHARRVIDAEAGKIIEEDLERVGVKNLHWMENGYADFISKDPLKTLEDFKGRRIRSFGELGQECVKALGGAPSFMGAGEVYMALQRRTIDGTITAITSMWDRKFFEVAKHMTQAYYSYIFFGVLMNLKKWNELPPDIQTTIMACAKEAQEWTRREVEKKDKQSLELLKKNGLDVYVLPEKERARWKKASEPVTEIFLKKSGEKGKKLMELAEKAH